MILETIVKRKMVNVGEGCNQCWAGILLLI
jgi:hypothetical protein